MTCTLDIVEAPIRSLPILTSGQKIRFGTIGLGLDLPRAIWTQENQVFSLQDHNLASHLPNCPQRQEGKPFEQQPKSFLKKNPVDVLLVEGSQRASSFSTLPEMLQLVSFPLRPTIIVLFGNAANLLCSSSLRRRRLRRKRMEHLGYQGVEWLLESCNLGSALDQETLADVFFKTTESRAVPCMPTQGALPPRAMGNLLLPCGIPRRDWAPEKLLQTLKMETWSGPTKTVGSVNGKAVFHPDRCMPNDLDCWVETERGTRRIQVQELTKAKGVPSEWTHRDTKLPSKVLLQSTGLHTLTQVMDHYY